MRLCFISFLSINPEYKTGIFIPTTLTALAVGALFTPLESVKIIGLTILTRVSYRVYNNLVSCRECIEYFTIDNKYVEPQKNNSHLNRYLITSLNPNTTAVVWGMKTIWPTSAVAGIIFAFLARVPFSGFKRKIFVSELAKVLIPSAFCLGILTRFYSISQKYHMHFIIEMALHEKYLQKKIEFKSLRYRDFPEVPSRLLIEWAACHARDLAGSLGFATETLLISIGIIAMRFFKKQ